MKRGVLWNPTDRTGGPVDDILFALRKSYPGLQVVRLSVSHPADDDNVWFISLPPDGPELQLDSLPNGRPPFLLESDWARAQTADIEEAIEQLSEWLRE
ncbi:hypothetical protein GCM10009682_08730 [Luedemannella flava]|uniref:Uncharacterized protein n=1 Tax=Luedemannella flava TaxID=349316 RepID=A0ABN2LHX9_9ACTN